MWPALGVQATLTRSSGVLSGVATLSAAKARGRIGATQLSTDLGADFKLDALNLIARTAHASGAVHVRNAALPNVPDPVSNWWADIRLDSLFGRASENLELGGTFRASLRDATPRHGRAGRAGLTAQVGGERVPVARPDGHRIAGAPLPLDRHSFGRAQRGTGDRARSACKACPTAFKARCCCACPACKPCPRAFSTPSTRASACSTATLGWRASSTFSTASPTPRPNSCARRIRARARSLRRSLLLRRIEQTRRGPVIR